ncbi:putative odorant receptor 92a [Frieseomelitta varia]|uniref:putative odorant receptor 92a n=1 Tax=Frieseomelitta varia TaxID=561572 RepID=UPI001CB69703|nr:putative odorant receptor 92a [Frieseomelitta varia]XP_043517129.1 putative odorant receptor 92a [Frieseomelitta varia]
MLENIANYRNVHYKSDTEYVYHVAKTLLTVIGIWPKEDTFPNNIKMYVQTAVVFFLMCFLLIPHVIYTYFDCENLTKYMKVIAAQVFSLLAIIKFWTVITNRKEIRFCLNEIEVQYRDVECEEDRLVMTNCAKIGRFFTTVYLGLSYTGALPYHIILPLISERIVKEDNTTQIPLPYLSDYVFFVIEDSPIYEMTFVLQIFISSLILSTNCGIYSLIASITMHSCSLFEVTNRRIEALCKWSEQDLRDRVVDVVQYHLRAIEYSALIGKCLSIVFLSEMVGCTIIICFLEFGVIMELEDQKTLSMITYFVLMTSIFVNVFIISFIGDRLRQESERIAETSYFLPWYDFPVDVAKDIQTIILRTYLPSSLSGAKILNLSLQAFCDVCKTSAAYFNFLRAMTA